MMRPWTVTAGFLMAFFPTMALAQYAPNQAYQSPPAHQPGATAQYPQTYPTAPPNQTQQTFPPTIQRVQPRQPANAPFVLNAQQEAQLDAVLKAWETSSKKVTRFECDFTRFHYDRVFGRKETHEGEIKFAAPDKGMFKVLGELVNDRLIKDQGFEHWVCDGKALYEHKPETKTLEVYELPPEEQGKAITESPLPFLFGAEAARLKERYHLRVTKISRNPTTGKEQVWLEAFPKLQKDAANFIRAEVILQVPSMELIAVNLNEPNGKVSDSYVFDNLKRNPSGLLAFFEGDPFEPRTPFGWKRVVKPAPSAQPNVTQTPRGPAR